MTNYVCPILPAQRKGGDFEFHPLVTNVFTRIPHRRIVSVSDRSTIEVHS
jgi:hypothetical protein